MTPSLVALAQLAVMAELLRRKCNAAMPEVDVGADVFAFLEDREEVVQRVSSYYNGEKKLGSLNKKNDELEITVEFRHEVTCSGQTLTEFRNAWRSLPAPCAPGPKG
jgi:hypothetical protein